MAEDEDNPVREIDDTLDWTSEYKNAFRYKPPYPINWAEKRLLDLNQKVTLPEEGLLTPPRLDERLLFPMEFESLITDDDLENTPFIKKLRKRLAAELDRKIINGGRC